jgi:fatty-acid peroxygenase
VGDGRLKAPDKISLRVFALERGENGELLESKIAAVEIINVLRPVVAIARFVIFSALALHDYPDSRERLKTGEEGYLEAFVLKVRRFYPFFPLVAALVDNEFEWRCYPFPKGRWVILDLYATDHHEHLWEQPEEFRTERFLGRAPTAFDLIPQAEANITEIIAAQANG